MSCLCSCGTGASAVVEEAIGFEIQSQTRAGEVDWGVDRIQVEIKGMGVNEII